ncbi:MAG: hypothetical protein WCY09_09030 [Candidatus Omnitrophota bacterium]
MKKLLITAFIFALFIAALWTDSQARDKPDVLLNTVQQYTGGERTTRSWAYTGILTSAAPCTTGWMQTGYDMTATVQDSNRMATQVGANTFAMYVRADSVSGTGTKSSVIITKAKVLMGINMGDTILYESGDQSSWIFTASDSTVTASKFRFYQIYLPSARPFKVVFFSTYADTGRVSAVIDGVRQ